MAAHSTPIPPLLSYDPPVESGTAAVPTEGAQSLKELERRHIEQVMMASRTLEDAAARLGINRATLWRKRKQYALK